MQRIDMVDNGQNRIRELLKKAEDFQGEKSAKLAALPKQVSRGDLFIFPVELPVTFVAVVPHSKNGDLWFVVPGDHFSQVGTQDVAVPEYSSEGEMNYRCGNGVWIHAEDFDFDCRIGQLEKIYVDQIHDHLGRIVRGNLPNVESIVDVDNDPDYEEWIEELTAAVSEFKQQLVGESTASGDAIHEEPVVYKFSTNWMAEAGIDTTVALAADSTGIGSIPEIDEDEVAPEGAPIDFDGNGILVAIKESSTICFHLYGIEGSQEPPKIIANKIELEWAQYGTFWATDDIEWNDGRVDFSIDGESQPPIER